MSDLSIGKGVYVYQPDRIERGVPEAIAARFHLAGVRTVAVKICDGVREIRGLEGLVQTLRDRGLQVGAWGYSYLRSAPVQEARAVAAACDRYHPDFYLIDVETEVEGNHGGARRFLSELRPAVAGLPLGLNSFWSVRLHPDFPWVDFLEAADFVCPQVYGHGEDPLPKLIESQQAFSDFEGPPQKPMSVVAGDMHEFKGRRPTPEYVLRFLRAADGDPFINGVMMWAADDSQTTPDLWGAFSSYQWQSSGPAIPEQPLGWAKVKALGGMWIRSSPYGSKLGGLARAELAPIWAITDTKWGAISRTGDQWVFIGNSSWVETTLELEPRDLPAPTGEEMFEARVIPSRGLNVRDGIWGRKLRALTVNSLVRVYETRKGWARIDPARSEWVSAAYLRRLAA